MPVKPEENLANLHIPFGTFFKIMSVICIVSLVICIELFAAILKIIYDSFWNGFSSEKFGEKNIWREVEKNDLRKKISLLWAPFV